MYKNSRSRKYFKVLVVVEHSRMYWANIGCWMLVCVICSSRARLSFLLACVVLTNIVIVLIVLSNGYELKKRIATVLYKIVKLDLNEEKTD